MKKGNRFNPVLASVTGHFALVGIFAWASAGGSEEPLRGVSHRGGATLVELVGSSTKVATHTPKSKPNRVKAESKTKIAAQAVEDTSVSSASSVVGFAEGAVGEGELGDPNGREGSVHERYLYDLRMLIERRKTYPVVSRRLGEAGRVRVAFKIEKDGRIVEADLRAPSHFARLNEAAIALIRGIDRFRPPPPGDAALPLELEVPIEYVLQ